MECKQRPKKAKLLKFPGRSLSEDCDKIDFDDLAVEFMYEMHDEAFWMLWRFLESNNIKPNRKSFKKFSKSLEKIIGGTCLVSIATQGMIDNEDSLRESDV